jgi:hypothetical protein
VILYRGTQIPDVKGYHTSLSWTPSLPVAVVWSARPGDVWSRREAAFLTTSTIHVGQLQSRKILELSEYTYSTFGGVLRELRFGKKGGISMDEAMKILVYMHRRLIGRARGGEFLYKVRGPEWEDLDEADLPFSLMDPVTLISEFADEFDSYADTDFADRLQADTYIFADAPAVQRAAKEQGHEVLLYPDVFQGGSYISEKLMGLPARNMKFVDMDRDIEGDEVPVHDTYRPLVEGAIVVTETLPTAQVLANVPVRDLRRV